MNSTPDVPLYPNYYEHNMGKLTNTELNALYTENLDADPRPWWHEAKPREPSLYVPNEQDELIYLRELVTELEIELAIRDSE